MTLSDFRYFESPRYYEPADGDPPVVFLAGGITGCPRWHDDAIELLHRTGLDMVVCNPNRENFPIGDPAAGREQVWWEQHHLLQPSTITMMWFPASDRTITVQPIAMFELGQCLNPATLAAGRRLVVGADPGYPRRPDVELMMTYHRSGHPVYPTLPAVVAAAASVVATGSEIGWNGPAPHTPGRNQQ